MKNRDTGYHRAAVFRYFSAVVMVLAAVSCTQAPQVATRVFLQPEIENPSRPALQPTQLELWQKLVLENRHASIEQKIVSVNEFFNRFDFIEDKYLWNRDDYWATLPETLDMQAGDCEDLSIAKYFTLGALNIPEENMRLTYVVSLETKEPHMVLTLMLDSAREPIVLDSVNNSLFSVSRRPDLVPVFSFNARGYWLAKKQDGWQGERIGSAAKLSLWKGVLQRMGREETEVSGG